MKNNMMAYYPSTTILSTGHEPNLAQMKPRIKRIDNALEQAQGNNQLYFKPRGAHCPMLQSSGLVLYEFMGICVDVHTATL